MNTNFEINRNPTRIIKDNLPQNCLNNYKYSFLYEFAITVDRKGVQIGLYFEVYKNDKEKEFGYITTRQFILTSDEHTDEGKYDAFYKCLLSELKEYIAALNKKKLIKYPSIEKIITAPSFEKIRPILKELFYPQSDFGAN
jgi:hypothetical protein